MKVRYTKSRFTPEVQQNVRDKLGLGAEKALFKYVRNKKRQKVGICVALPNNRIGWSRCANNKNDEFDRPIGYELALRRALKSDNVPVPDDVNWVLNCLREKAGWYFQEKNV